MRLILWLIWGVNMSEGLKHDAGKLEYDLLPYEAMNEIVKAFMFGAKKYERDNWKLVKDGKKRYNNAMMRHYVAIQNGEDIDDESGLLHGAHMAVNAIFSLWFDIQERKIND